MGSTVSRNAPPSDHVPAGAEAPPDDVPTGAGGRRRRSWLLVLLVLAAAVAGGVATLVLTSPGSAADVPSRGIAPERAAPVDGDGLATAGFVELPPPPTEVPPSPAADPAGAVEGFLAAEVLDDLAASYAFLSPETQATFGGSPASWVAAHADVLPPITRFAVGEVTTTDDGTATVASTIGLEPSLDEVVGLVPAQADVVWTVVSTSDGPAIELEASSFTPRFIPDGRAPADVAAWVASRQACGRDGEWGGTLLGVEGPVRELCGAEGAVQVGAPAPLGELEAAAFTTAFGEDALLWAREVTVSGPVELRAVVAPVGSRWLVIGALPADGPGT